MFLLDTNVISELRKRRPHGALLAWYHSHHESNFYLPTIALYELQAGVEVTRYQDAAKALEIEQWIESLENAFPILPLNAKAGRESAKLMHGKSGDLFEDAMIAAIARTHGLTVVTRNTKDFDAFPVPKINPFLFTS